jgi:hypothetical protein
MSLVADIAAYLVSQGFGTLGTSIFLDELLDSPDNQIAVFGSGIKGTEFASGDNGQVLEYPYFDVHVRNTSKATARTTMENIRQLLRYNTEISGYWLICGTPPYHEYFGKDESNRYRYAAFFVAAIAEEL